MSARERFILAWRKADSMEAYDAAGYVGKWVKIKRRWYRVIKRVEARQ